MINRKILSSRMSKIVEYNNVIYFAGIVPKNKNKNIKEQTLDVLELAHELFDEAGTSKEYLLKVDIYLKDIDKDFASFNEVWDSWVSSDNPPARACVEASMSSPQTLVEIVFIAVKKDSILKNIP